MTHHAAVYLAHAGAPRALVMGEITDTAKAIRRFHDTHANTTNPPVANIWHGAGQPGNLERIARLRALAISRGEYKMEGKP